MKLELPYPDLLDLTARQIDNLFGLDIENERAVLAAGMDVALRRSEFCFARVENKYYHLDGETCFSPFHSGQYTIFLYYLANSIFSLAPRSKTLADRVYLLNKTLNCLDLFYEVQMPAVFFLDHPVGSVMGRATYGDYFSFGQNCTVGNNKGAYPVIGRNVRMMSGSTVLGKCRVGDDVVIAANAFVKDTDVPSCSIVFGSSPAHIVKTKDKTYFRTGFRFTQ